MTAIGFSSDYQHEGSQALCDALVARAQGRPVPRYAELWADEHLFASLAHARLMACGKDRGINPAARGDVIRLALTTSDFSHWLSGAYTKLVTELYANASPTFQRVGKRSDFKDFRSTSLLNPSDFPTPTETAEAGETRRGAIIEGGEAGALATYSSRAALSYQSLVNDDSGIFGSIAEAAALRAVDRVESLFWSTILSNAGAGPTLRDGVAYFATARGNLASSGSAISTTSIGAARAAMMRFAGPGGSTSVSTPKFLVCAPEKLALAEAETAKLALGADAQTRLTVIGTPHIPGNAWFLFAPPAQRPSFAYGYLEGTNGPQVSARPHWETDGVEFVLVIDAHVTPVDWRGCYQDPGA
ncbi:MAG: hypothetical protein M5U32_11050 [Myxococcota bacterium]|nr:hypothetical protein [Myxococcota bacterium]